MLSEEKSITERFIIDETAEILCFLTQEIKEGSLSKSV